MRQTRSSAAEQSSVPGVSEDLETSGNPPQFSTIQDDFLVERCNGQLQVLKNFE